VVRIQHLEDKKFKGLILSHYLPPPVLRQKNTSDLTTARSCIILQKTPTTGAQGIGTLNQKQLQMCKSQCRNMKQQGNSSPSKANSTTKDRNNNEEEEISNIDFQNIIVKMINELKQEIQKLPSNLKEDMNKQLKGSKRIQTDG
jgi:hypothetical protein